MSPLIVSGGCAAVLLVAGGLATPIGSWYKALRKPWWQPPGWAFGPAWTILLGLAAWSAAIAWQAAPYAAARQSVVILFAVNAACHFAWSPLFFAVRRPDWALVEVVFLWGSLVALLVGLWPISHFAAALIVPYFLWVSFAAVLNRKIVQLNGPFG
ncbi:TspO/MBR family protein [Sphingomonas sp. 10B4]|uniref:TspO/MBR family protein n=1 Tax=Sphingomonas sp. 10B4 TaxID=3048575 RepID=UPI002AB42133|nr:TspO/MBR family protein [Sphingomonas sp. 10B4]MDY7524242.1 TspO/MBR family protein [Sphingomonas sp. 10B4]MEB0281926.1 TspO/MBR family protein [Sphingomonas sp. 10B4]